MVTALVSPELPLFGIGNLPCSFGLAETTHEDNIMNSLRNDDLSATAQDQIYSISGMWYFRADDGKDIGPFRYECEARQMLDRLTMEQAAQQQQGLLHPGKLHFRVNPARTSSGFVPAG